jgi:hypothetical protein
VGRKIQHPPTKPKIVGDTIDAYGYASAVLGSVSEYSITSSNVDSDAGPLYYEIDWRDGSAISNSGPIVSGSPFVVQHKWTKTGQFQVAIFVSDGRDGIQNGTNTTTNALWVTVSNPT